MATKFTHDWATIMEMYHSGDTYLKQKAQEWAIENLKGFVIHFANKKYPTYIKRYGDDIIQSGYIGVLEALSNYDPEKSMPSTYFKYSILGAMQRYVDEFIDATTVHYGQIYRKANKAIDFFESNEIAWDYTMIANYIGVSKASIEQACFIKQCKTELDSSGNLGNIKESASLFNVAVDFIADMEEKSKTDDMINTIFSLLTDEEAMIIKAVYGWDTVPMSYNEIARKLGYTGNRVKNIALTAISRLQVTLVGPKTPLFSNPIFMACI